MIWQQEEGPFGKLSGMDAKTKARYASEDRIGVLEELLGERYSVRAFLPQPVPREIIEHILTVAQRTASCGSRSASAPRAAMASAA